VDRSVLRARTRLVIGRDPLPVARAGGERHHDVAFH